MSHWETLRRPDVNSHNINVIPLCLNLWYILSCSLHLVSSQVSSNHWLHPLSRQRDLYNSSANNHLSYHPEQLFTTLFKKIPIFSLSRMANYPISLRSPTQHPGNDINGDDIHTISGEVKTSTYIRLSHPLSPVHCTCWWLHWAKWHTPRRSLCTLLHPQTFPQLTDMQP